MRHFTDQISVNGWNNLLTAIEAAGYTGYAKPIGETRVLNWNASIAYLHFSDDTVTAPNLAGTSQVETATIVGGCTIAGDLVITVTAAGLAGSPLDVKVALLLTDDDATKVATKCRTALAATSAITDMFTVGGTGADITLTQIVRNGNDGTLNIDINADDIESTSTGVTNAPASVNTTAGVHAGLGGYPLSSAAASAPSGVYVLPRGISLSNVWLYTGSALTINVSVSGE